MLVRTIIIVARDRMSNGSEIPERCLLSGAARYVADQEVSLPDVTSPRPSVPWFDQLIWALKSKKLCARGNLYDASYDEDSKEWEKNVLRQENVEVNAAFWLSREAIDLEQSTVLGSNEDVQRIYKLRPDRAFLVNEETGDERCLKTGFVFSQITVPTKELFELFPPHNEGELVGHQKEPSERTKGVGGRLPQYQWDQLWIELIVKLYLEGFPETQAELVGQAAQMCEDMWGRSPTDSVLKEKIARIYNHPRWKAGN
jgi:hypothetical protein